MSHRLPPLNGLRAFEAAGRHLSFKQAAEELAVTAQALANKDPHRAQVALDRLRQVEAHMDVLEEALQGGRETSTLSPVRWSRRGALTQYVEGAEYIDHAVHNSGTLVRRSVTVLEDGEPVPPSLPLAVSQLADAVRQLLQELGIGVEPVGARERALRASTTWSGRSRFPCHARVPHARRDSNTTSASPAPPRSSPLTTSNGIERVMSDNAQA